MSARSPLLEARKLTVGIGGRVFCRDLDLALAPGERLVILGRNGAGKSTLLSVLAGLRTPVSGEVRIGGASYAALGARKSALIRGWLPQARGDAFASTVLETVLVGRHPHLERWGWESEKDAKIVRQALAAGDLVEALPGHRIDSPLAYWLIVGPRSGQRPEVQAFCAWLELQAQATREAIGDAPD